MKRTIYTTPGQRIYYLRKKHNFSQEDLANRTGTTAENIHRLEIGLKPIPPYPSLEIIAGALSSSIRYILGWEYEPTMEDNVEVLSTYRHDDKPIWGATGDYLYNLYQHNDEEEQKQPYTQDDIFARIPDYVLEALEKYGTYSFPPADVLACTEPVPLDEHDLSLLEQYKELGITELPFSDVPVYQNNISFNELSFANSPDAQPSKEPDEVEMEAPYVATIENDPFWIMQDRTYKECDDFMETRKFDLHIHGYLTLTLRKLGYAESEINHIRATLDSKILGKVSAAEAREVGRCFGVCVEPPKKQEATVYEFSPKK